MALKLPNYPDAAREEQAQTDKVDWDILTAAIRGTGTVSGCLVTSTGAANGSVAVAAGELAVKNRVCDSSANAALAIAANSSGFPRIDLISAGVAGTPTVTQGTPGTGSLWAAFPALPTDHAAYAVVYVPNGHTATTVIPVGDILDRRIELDDQGMGDYRGGEDFEVLIKQKDVTRPPLTVKSMNTLGTVIQAKDYLDAPIAWLLTTGGLYVNDTIRTTYHTEGPHNWAVDIYGYMWRGSQASFAFNGAPGNMLSFADACHELFQGSRAPSLANWSVVSGGTIANVSLAQPFTNHPTRLSQAIRITNTSGSTVWFAQPGGAFALPGVVAGQVYSAIANVRFASAAAARNCSIRLQFYNDAGVQQGSDVNSANVSIPNSGTAWTAVPINGTIAPANATRVQLHILMASLNTETHDVNGAAIMKGSPVASFAPPFVSQNTDGSPATTNGIALAGARWTRNDVPNQPGRREYVNQVAGQPYEQRWVGLDAASLYPLDADVISTSTTAAAVSPFAVILDANGTYRCYYELFVTSAATTTGWQLGFTGPASPTNVFAVCEYMSSATVWTTAKVDSFTTFTLVTAAYVAAPSIIPVRILMLLNNGSNAGTLNLTWRTEVASSAVTIKKGSILSVT